MILFIRDGLTLCFSSLSLLQHRGLSSSPCSSGDSKKSGRLFPSESATRISFIHSVIPATSFLSRSSWIRVFISSMGGISPVDSSSVHWIYHCHLRHRLATLAHTRQIEKVTDEKRSGKLVVRNTHCVRFATTIASVIVDCKLGFGSWRLHRDLNSHRG